MSKEVGHKLSEDTKLAGAIFEEGCDYLIIAMKGDNVVGHSSSSVAGSAFMIANYVNEVGIPIELIESAIRYIKKTGYEVLEKTQVFQDESRNDLPLP